MRKRPARVLSIEDDRQVRESIEDWLGDSGYDVVTAPTGEAGLAAFGKREPDIVLLDMGLPDMHGLKVLEQLLALAPRTPVVIVSANAHINDAINAFKAGAWDYVTKPILNFGALEQTIQNCLERRDLKDKVRRAEERYRTLLQNLPMVIFSMDANLKLEFINDSSTDVLGYPPDEAMASPDWFASCVHEDDRDDVLAALAAACAHSNPEFHLTFRFRHKKGYLLHLTAQSLLTGGEPTAPASDDADCRRPDGLLSGIITDVTERAFLEKAIVQHEKINTLGAMSHVLAHEIRNPLMSLGGFALRLTRKFPRHGRGPPSYLSRPSAWKNLMNRISTYVAPVPVHPKNVNVSAALTFCLDRLSPGLVRRGLDIRPRLDPQPARHPLRLRPAHRNPGQHRQPPGPLHGRRGHLSSSPPAKAPATSASNSTSKAATPTRYPKTPTPCPCPSKKAAPPSTSPSPTATSNPSEASSPSPAHHHPPPLPCPCQLGESAAHPARGGRRKGIEQAAGREVGRRFFLPPAA